MQFARHQSYLDSVSYGEGKFMRGILAPHISADGLLGPKPSHCDGHVIRVFSRDVLEFP